MSKHSLFCLIGGKFKGHPLKAPRGLKTRPTTALLRKSIFDMIRPYLEGSSFLDLYAGSGAIGLEALSQGASHVTFVDSSKEAIACIKHNVHSLGLEEKVKIEFGSVSSVIKKLPENSFDILYADPPYDHAESHIALLQFLSIHPLVREGGLVLLEEGYPSPLTLPPPPGFFHKDSRHFGKSLLHQYRRLSLK